MSGRGFSFDSVSECRSLDQLHGEIRLGLELTNLIDRTDVGMIDGRGRLGLTLEALKRKWIAGHLFRKELQCNFALELQVFCAIDDAHAAATQFLEDAIV